MGITFEFKEVDTSKEKTYEELPEGMFRMTEDNRLSIGYKFGAFSIFFEPQKIILGNTIQRKNDRIFLPLPNVKITIEEL
jgi:hypothetical protein